MVDVFASDKAGIHLTHVQGVRVIPADEHEGDYWADEVRTSLSNGDAPRYLYASTRGLKPGKKGFVAVYRLREDGTIDDDYTSPRTASSQTESRTNGDRDDLYAGLLCMYETPTSGGWANAIQPGPTIDGVEYLALTDSEEGFVFVLTWDGSQIREVARTKLDPGAGAATAVWL
jgi:carboxy-cis,cis-muconate cyclase